MLFADALVEDGICDCPAGLRTGETTAAAPRGSRSQSGTLDRVCGSWFKAGDAAPGTLGSVDVAFSIEPLNNFGRDGEPDIRGLLVVWQLDDGDAEAILYVRPDQDVSEADKIREDCFGRIERLLTVGPEPDNWQKRHSDEGWQLWLRQMWMPTQAD